MKNVFKLKGKFLMICSLIMVVLLVGCSDPVDELVDIQKNAITNELTPTVEEKVISARLRYGQTETIPWGTRVPNGWVIIQSDSIWRTNTIMYVGGAKYGQTETIIWNSKIPNNWVIIKSDSIWKTNTIMYVGGAKYGQIETITWGSRIPNGWVVIKSDSIWRTNIIKYIG